MIVELTNIGNIYIVTAEKDSYGDIYITCEDDFAKLSEHTAFPVLSAALVEWDSTWDLVADLKIPEKLMDEYDDYHVFQVKNQVDIQRLNAFL